MPLLPQTPPRHVSNRLADRKQRETVVNSMQVLCPMDRSDHAVRVLTSSAFSAWISRVISLSREPLRSKITVCSDKNAAESSIEKSFVKYFSLTVAFLTARIDHLRIAIQYKTKE